MDLGPPSESLRLVFELSQSRGLRLDPDELPRFTISGGRVAIADDIPFVRPGTVPVFLRCRDRMIVLRQDRDHPALAFKTAKDCFDPRYDNAPRIGSSNSEDAVTWSFLRALEVRGPAGWFREAMARGLKRAGNGDRLAELPGGEPSFQFWQMLLPPPGYRVREGASEIDALATLPDGSMISIEAKLGAGLSAGTKYAPDRNQLVRNIDVASWRAAEQGAPGYWPALLVSADAAETIEYARRLAGASETLVEKLPHRPAAEMRVLAGRIAVMTWEDLLEVAGGSDG